MGWLYAIAAIGSLLIGGYNVWQQQQANKQVQDFNSDEAEKNRQWQEETYQKYNSPLAQVLQRTQAGLNPYGDISSHPVGTGSTASSGSSSLPGLPDAFSMLPSQIMQLKSFKVEQQQKEATLAKTKEETTSLILENQMKALEAGNKEEWINLQIEIMRNDVESRKWSAEKLKAEASRAWDVASQSRQFTESGGNEFEDSHQKLLAELSKVKSDINLSDVQRSIAEHTFSLSQKFDYKFLQLDYEERKTAVEEYLANSENRKEFNTLSHELYKEIQKASKYEITEIRAKLLSVDSILAEDLLNSAINDKFGRFDTVLLKWFQSNPGGIVQLATQFIPNVTYSPKTINPTKIITR